MSDRPTRSVSGHDLARPSDADLRDRIAALTDEEKRVMLRHGTEPAFCGGLLENKAAGVYPCKLCRLPLFRSDAKFDSGTGWPSFTQSVDPDHVRYIDDDGYGMIRTEIRCGRCDSHLGHVFDDGPRPTGRRYCLNSVSLQFEADDGSS